LRLYKTGDVGRFLPDGSIEFLGRADNQVKVRGFRVELHEIELALSSHPSVRDCVVTVHEDAPSRKRLVAYVVPKQDGMIAAGELKSFLSARLPEYMTPAAFMTLESLPMSPNGKVDRRALPAPAAFRPEMEATYLAPRNEIETMLAAIWQDALRLDKVGVHDNFFDLGGHSLLMVQVHSKMREALKKDIAMVDLFQYPTVSALAGYLNRETPDQSFEQRSLEEIENLTESRRRRREARLVRSGTE
jgi:acyl carrier protein